MPNAPLNPIEAAQRQRRVILRILRSAFFVLVITFTMLSILRPPQTELSKEVAIRWWIPLNVAVLFFLAALGVDLATPRKKVSTIFAVILGLLVGILTTAILSILVDLLLESWIADPAALQQVKPLVKFVQVLAGMTFSYLAISAILQTQDDYRLVIPYVEFAKQVRGARPLLLDSSVLIDARIADIAQTGFIQTPVVIPRFIINELQTMADSGDDMKRARGRRGLDVVTRLQRVASLDLSIDETIVPGKAADQMLVELARQMNGVIATGDVALTRVASIHGLGTLNLNELANALKPAVIPGEQLIVRLIRRGEQPSQGVGYLADGTMVVAENGSEAIGREVALTVTSTLQTSAGKLIFGRMPQEPTGYAAAPAEPREPEAPARDGVTGTAVTGEVVAAPTDGVSRGGMSGSAGSGGSVSSSSAVNAAVPVNGAPVDEAGVLPSASSMADASGRTPYPPKPPRTLRAGTPRNPRR